MYYQNYEDYMRQVLGYPTSNSNIYETYNYSNNREIENTYSPNTFDRTLTDSEIMELYPESYNVIYPIVCRICDANTETITKELIERMTDEVYNLVENNRSVVNVNVETPKIENREASLKTRHEIKQDNISSKRTPVSSENRENLNKLRQTRQTNRFLNDFIRLLILERLFGGINRPPSPRPPRPPFPGNPGRPPFPGGPGRPPINPRTEIDAF